MEPLDSFKEMCRKIGGKLRGKKEGLVTCVLPRPKTLEISTPPYGLRVDDAEEKRSFLIPLVRGSYRVNITSPLGTDVTVSKPELGKHVTETKTSGRFKRIDFMVTKEGETEYSFIALFR